MNGIERVELMKRKRVRFNDTYGDKFETVDWIEPKEMDSERMVFSWEARVQEGDRIIYGRRVFDVTGVSENLSTMTQTAFVKPNDTETALLRMSDGNCEIEYGLAELASKDHAAERWMDSWVGIYALHIIRHYKRIREGRELGALFDIFGDSDTACACVGAGPSLDKNIEALRDFPGIIICADRAYKSLKARGIKPDLVLSVDCHEDLIAEMLKGPDSTLDTLVLNTCTDPQTADVWKGKIYWFNMRHPGVQFMDHVLPVLFPNFGALENCGNVGNASVLLADFMGLKHIVLVGQDYGYTGGKMHADRWEFAEDGTPKGVVETDHAALFEKRTGKVTASGVVTYAAFITYARSLLAQMEKKRLDIMNCTEGGILTDFRCRPLAEVCGELSKRVAAGSLLSADNAKKRIARIKEE